MRSLLLVLALAQQTSTPRQTDTGVERGRAGPVAIGASAESVYDQFRERAKLVDLKLEGMLSPALELRLFGAQTAPSMIAEIGPANKRLVVTRISVFDPRVRTKDGIGVGSTYDELRARYRVEWVGSGEGGYYAVANYAGHISTAPGHGPSLDRCSRRKTLHHRATESQRHFGDRASCSFLAGS